ncbi:MAG TPA: LPS-assembly protein LptD, partial [Paraburkholderia sp.]|nr:LPS-assembly protein LptD [Paraburkholderia sp.]
MPPRQLFPITPSSDGLPRRRRLAAALIAVPGLLPALSHAQLAGEAAQAQPIDAPWGLRLAPQLEGHSTPDGQSPATFVLGDSTTGTADQDIAAKGSAEVRRGTSALKADALHYDQDTDMADAYGNVHLSGNGARFTGPEAHMRLES